MSKIDEYRKDKESHERMLEFLERATEASADGEPRALYVRFDRGVIDIYGRDVKRQEINSSRFLECVAQVLCEKWREFAELACAESVKRMAEARQAAQDEAIAFLKE